MGLRLHRSTLLQKHYLNLQWAGASLNCDQRWTGVRHFVSDLYFWRGFSAWPNNSSFCQGFTFADLMTMSCHVAVLVCGRFGRNLWTSCASHRRKGVSFHGLCLSSFPSLTACSASPSSPQHPPLPAGLLTHLASFFLRLTFGLCRPLCPFINYIYLLCLCSSEHHSDRRCTSTLNAPLRLWQLKVTVAFNDFGGIMWPRTMESAEQSDDTRRIQQSRPTPALFLWLTTLIFDLLTPKLLEVSRTYYATLVCQVWWFLANVNVLRYVCYMLSAVRLSSVVCCLWRWCTLLRRLNFSAIFFTIR